MSKLFDTLDQIQQHDETASKPEQPVAPTPGGQSNSRFFPFLVGLTVVVAIFAALQFYGYQRNRATIRSAKQIVPPVLIPQPLPPGAIQSQPPKGSNEEKMTFFNNKGVELASAGEYWPAVYYFDQAEQVMPQRPEPAINMAVTLAHLGLRFPAMRYFQKAKAISPNHKQLQQAMARAITAKQINADFAGQRR